MSSSSIVDGHGRTCQGHVAGHINGRRLPGCLQNPIMCNDGCPISITWACVRSQGLLPIPSSQQRPLWEGGLSLPAQGLTLRWPPHSTTLYGEGRTGPFLLSCTLVVFYTTCECLQVETHPFKSDGKICKSIINFLMYFCHITWKNLQNNTWENKIFLFSYSFPKSVLFNHFFNHNPGVFLDILFLMTIPYGILIPQICNISVYILHISISALYTKRVRFFLPVNN